MNPNNLFVSRDIALKAKHNLRELVSELCEGSVEPFFGRLTDPSATMVDSSTPKCCLGKACWIFNQAGWERSGEDWSYRGQTAGMPKEVMDFYGFTSAAGSFTFMTESGPEHGNLMCMNDSGVTHRTIGLFIRQCWEELVQQPLF